MCKYLLKKCFSDQMQQNFRKHVCHPSNKVTPQDSPKVIVIVSLKYHCPNSTLTKGRNRAAGADEN